MINYKLTYFDQILINRVKACLLDFIICLILILITFFIFKVINILTLNLFNEVFLFIIPVIFISYYSFSIGSEKGITFGMKFFRINLINKSNSRLTIKELLLYNLIFFIVVPIGSILLISIIYPLINNERKCIHDYVFKTKFNLKSNI